MKLVQFEEGDTGNVIFGKGGEGMAEFLLIVPGENGAGWELIGRF